MQQIDEVLETRTGEPSPVDQGATDQAFRNLIGKEFSTEIGSFADTDPLIPAGDYSDTAPVIGEQEQDLHDARVAVREAAAGQNAHEWMGASAAAAVEATPTPSPRLTQEAAPNAYDELAAEAIRASLEMLTAVRRTHLFAPGEADPNWLNN